VGSSFEYPFAQSINQPKRRDRIGRFCRIHDRVKQTGRQTDGLRHKTCTNSRCRLIRTDVIARLIITVVDVVITVIIANIHIYKMHNAAESSKTKKARQSLACSPRSIAVSSAPPSERS